MTRTSSRFLLFAAVTLAVGTAAMFLPVEWRLPGPAPAPSLTTTTTARPAAFPFTLEEFVDRWDALATPIPDLVVGDTVALTETLHHVVFAGADALAAGGTLVDLFLFTDDTGQVVEILLQCRGPILETPIADLFGVYAAAAALGLPTVEDTARFAVPIMGIELFPVIGHHSVDDESLITMRIGSVRLIREASPGLLAYRVTP